MTGTPPEPCVILHFTHVRHLAGVVKDGLLCDTAAQLAGCLTHEAGNTGIKAMRRQRAVPIDPGGVVADYVPFYFAPRSPMMYSIYRGNVATFEGSADELVYLVTTVQQQLQAGRDVLFTDRNAVLQYAAFTNDVDDLPELVDWDLMKATMWNNTGDHPDRMERRMAECLVHEAVDWGDITDVVVSSKGVASEVQQVLDDFDDSTPVHVRPGWYF